MPLVVSVLTFLAGLLVPTGGADWFVNGTVRLAEWMRVSRLLVGLTVVAFGMHQDVLMFSVTKEGRVG